MHFSLKTSALVEIEAWNEDICIIVSRENYLLKIKEIE